MGKKSTSNKAGNQSLWIVAGVAVVAVAALIGISLLSARGDKVVSGTDAELGAVRNVKGAATAKVTLVEYNDYL